MSQNAPVDTDAEAAHTNILIDHKYCILCAEAVNAKFVLHFYFCTLYIVILHITFYIND